jgi:hypothetical protein
VRDDTSLERLMRPQGSISNSPLRPTR